MRTVGNRFAFTKTGSSNQVLKLSDQPARVGTNIHPRGHSFVILVKHYSISRPGPGEGHHRHHDILIFWASQTILADQEVESAFNLTGKRLRYSSRRTTAHRASSHPVGSVSLLRPDSDN